MIALGYYLLKVLICSAVLFLYYHFFLRNKAFHQWNRFYLLFLPVFSLLLPFLQFNVDQNINNNNAAVRFIEIVNSADNYFLSSAKSSVITIEQVIIIIYGLISVFFLFKLIRSLLRIRNLKIQNNIVNLNGVFIIPTEEKETPFSFFNYLFWNKHINLNTPVGQMIFKHELVHIKQKHTIDKLFIEIIISVFWYNPIFWYIRKELSIIHEFIADKKSVDKGSAELFASMVLQSVYPKQYQYISNQFFQSSIKRRLSMFNSQKNPRFNYVSRILLLPLLVIITASYTVKLQGKSLVPFTQSLLNQPDTIPNATTKYYNSKSNIFLEANKIIDHTSKVDNITFNLDEALFIIDGKKSNASILLEKTIISNEIHFYSGTDPDMIALYGDEAVMGVVVFKDAKMIDIPTRKYYEVNLVTTDTIKPDPKNILFTKVEVAPGFPGGEKGWRSYLVQNLNASTPIDNGAPEGQFTTETEFIVDLDGSVSDIKALSKHGFGMEDEVIRLIKNGPKWIPANQNGRQVRAVKKQKVTFVVTKG
jgi:beta-lactamase regulating signal transducer with metallopeptidase domain